MKNTAHNITAEEAITEVTRRFSEKITPAMAAVITHDSDPVALQYLPDIRELETRPEEHVDPIGDHTYSPVKGIVHRHADRVLFKVSSVCAVNCRFCFRKMMLGTPEETLNLQEVDEALAYIENHPEIWEVILTGGDPLILSPRRISRLMDRLEAIDHVRIIRIHSRIPVADPQRMDDAFCQLLNREKPVYMVIHINHVQEITPQAEQIFRRLHRNGVTLLSQSVLLKNINDTVEALESLYRKLVEMRIKPYYLHHPDLVPGTNHFRVGIEQGQLLMKNLRARASGLCLPAYVLDIPGGYGKIPLENAYITSVSGGYIITDYQGRNHTYSKN
ncbi:MAG: lysine-2,3-aminomutase-like protein [Alphaproteobacteria bacterium CG_4_9_14_3_um_filter_47_13]|nr:MAG: lysine-2,3-aminomutase-like protein [Alphaproteobacteria bacterium CG_4_9_14_3_um_filter_47_13]